MKRNLLTLLLATITTIGIQAQTHTDQNGIKTSVVSGLTANGTQAKRYEVITVGYNSVHWGSSGNIIVELFHTYFSTGYEKYQVEIGYGQGTGSSLPLLKLIESTGPNHNARVTLGTGVDSGTDYGGHDNYKIPIYVDVKHYSNYRVRITYQQTRVTGVPNKDQIVIHESPTGTNIADFSIQNVNLFATGYISASGDISSSGNFNSSKDYHFNPGYGLNGHYFGAGETHSGAYSIIGNNAYVSPTQNNTVLYKTSNTDGASFLAMGYHYGLQYYVTQNGTSKTAGSVFQTVNGSTSSSNLAFHVGLDKNVLIPNGDLVVSGDIESKKIKVTAQPGTVPDYVFAPTYKLQTLNELEDYIRANKHLPNIKSAKEIEANGQDLGDMQLKLLEKIEELTLYTIAQEKEIKSLQHLLSERGVSPSGDQGVEQEKKLEVKGDGVKRLEDRSQQLEAKFETILKQMETLQKQNQELLNNIKNK